MKPSGRPGSSAGKSGSTVALKEKEKQEKSDKHKDDKRGSGEIKEKEERPTSGGSSPQLLRKRTSSYPGTTKEKLGAGALHDGSKDKGIEGDVHKSPLKPGQSVLEQIGEPDHAGWMRKKGDRYNSWKLRYFVLKGSHLYYLRSDSTSVGSFASLHMQTTLTT